MSRKTRILLLAAGTSFATLVSFVPAVLSTPLASAAGSPPTSPTTIYDTTSTPLVGSPSFSFEATSTAEMGNLIQFASGPARLLTGATVTMDSWGCQSGSWTNNPSPCVTTPGSTFSEPITLNLYNVGPSNAVGSLITSVTQTFNIPYRPSTDPSCPLSTDDGSAAPGDMEDFVYGGTCVHGLPTNVTFSLGDVVVPNSVIWSIAYNTSDYGAHPYGDLTACHSTSEGCGYDSLNLLATTANGPSVGSDPLPGTAYESSTWTGDYCDSGAAGTGTFRLDSANDNGTPCYGVNTSSAPPWYIPAVQFNAVPELSVASSNTTSLSGQSVTFTVSGPPTATQTVTVNDGSSSIGTCALSGGTCQVSTSTLSIGSHSISATFSGGGGFPAFSSAAIGQKVSPVPVTVMITSFKYKKDGLTSGMKSQIRRLAHQVQSGQFTSVALVGYCDNGHDANGQKNYSLKRAQVVEDYLLHQFEVLGVTGVTVTASGGGSAMGPARLGAVKDRRVDATLS